MGNGKPDTAEQAIENLEWAAKSVQALGVQRAKLAKSRPNIHRDDNLQKHMSSLAHARKSFDAAYDDLVELVGQFKAKIELRRIERTYMPESYANDGHATVLWNYAKELADRAKQGDRSAVDRELRLYPADSPIHAYFKQRLKESTLLSRVREALNEGAQDEDIVVAKLLCSLDLSKHEVSHVHGYNGSKPWGKEGQEVLVQRIPSWEYSNGTKGTEKWRVYIPGISRTAVGVGVVAIERADASMYLKSIRKANAQEIARVGQWRERLSWELSR